MHTDFDRLLLGIESILAHRRAVFSDDEIALLEECLHVLHEQKNLDDFDQSLTVFTKVMELLAKVFGVYEMLN